MRRRLIVGGFALAALPCAYACFVYGWQLVSFTGIAVRLGEDLPSQTWGQIALVAGQMVVIAAALMIVWQGVQARRYGKAGLALAVGWLATGPLLILLVTQLPPGLV